MKTIGPSILLIFAFSSGLSAQHPIWLDADTGNEMDDLYAIVRLLSEPGIDLVGLSSAHFNNPDLVAFEKWNDYNTRELVSVEESQELNERLLAYFDRMALSHPQGADRMIGRSWGGETPRDSPAAQGMIAAARQLPEGERLHIITLGPLTNVASALQLAPDVLPRISIFALGAQYDLRKKAWNKNEFNIRNDLNAFDYLLNLEGLDLTVMPLQTAEALTFDRSDTFEQLDARQPAQALLLERWRKHHPEETKHVMWDLALVEAYLHPEFATIKKVKTPPENTKRKVKVYTAIKGEPLINDFWASLK